jgi:regulator of sirC expression with transglutaminase-like and TPR domain
LPQLRELLAEADPPARGHIAEVIADLESEHADALFEQLCAEFGDDGDLEEAAWRLAATFEPGEDFGPARRQVDDWGDEVTRRLRKAVTAQDRIETLVEFLGHDLGFRGNEVDYYNINNSLLPEVIETRRGIPITLSLIYILVGRRAGLPVDGVGLPGHFVIRCGEAFFDPFHGGRRLGFAECRTIVEEQNLSLTPEHLQPVNARQILTRMLGNLHAVANESDPPLASKIAGWINRLNAVSRSGR